MMCINVFNITRNEISVGSDKKMRNFPKDPHFKNSHDVTEVGGFFYNGGLLGKSEGSEALMPGFRHAE